MLHVLYSAGVNGFHITGCEGYFWAVCGVAGAIQRASQAYTSS